MNNQQNSGAENNADAVYHSTSPRLLIEGVGPVSDAVEEKTTGNVTSRFNGDEA